MADAEPEQITDADEDIEPDPERERERERERRAHHQMAMQLVRQYPDPALRVAANSIAEVDDEVRNLVERMSEVMRRSHGVGLAAPQVGVLRRVFVYRAGADDPVRVLINPQLGEKSDETEVDRGAASNLTAADVDLDDLGLGREELWIREVCSEHQENVAVLHGLVAGAEADQAGESDVKWIVELDVLLATERVHDRRL